MSPDSAGGRAPARSPHRPVSPLADALRAATAAAHRDLDRSAPLAALLRPDVGAAELGGALAAMHPVQAAAEALVGACARSPSGAAGAADEDDAWTLRPRAAAILADLHALGRVPRPLAAVLPPAPRTPAERIGLLYVLEGSMLGSAVIARHLAARLPDAPRAHFGDGDGAAAHRRWAAFWRWADAQALPPRASADAVAAARALFAAFTEQMRAG